MVALFDGNIIFLDEFSSIEMRCSCFEHENGAAQYNIDDVKRNEMGRLSISGKK